MKFLPKFSASKKRIYFDYASITPIDPRIIKVMAETMKDFSANPSSLYKEGVEAKKFLDLCRKRVATSLYAHSDEILFTSGGTEANNLAIKGVIEKVKEKIEHPHIITTAIEHPSVLELIEWCKNAGCDVTVVPVLENGLVDPKEIKNALTDETILVSVMYVNNEIGTIQPISEIAKTIRTFKKNKTNNPQYPYFHTDASQAALYCSLRIPALGVDLLTLDASKFYGPRGSGVLYKKRSIQLEPQQLGGSQEMDIRAGTENLPAIAGLALALEIAQKDKEKERERIGKLRDYMWSEIQKELQQTRLNGSIEERVPNNLNICIPGADAEFLVLKLDVRGIAVSSVTSCRNLAEDSSSYVVDALGTNECSKSSLRITLGRYTTQSDIKILLKALKEILKK